LDGKFISAPSGPFEKENLGKKCFRQPYESNHSLGLQYVKYITLNRGEGLASSYTSEGVFAKPSKATNITQKPLSRGKVDASFYTSKSSDIWKKGDAESVHSPKVCVTYT